VIDGHTPLEIKMDKLILLLVLVLAIEIRCNHRNRPAS